MLEGDSGGEHYKAVERFLGARAKSVKVKFIGVCEFLDIGSSLGTYTTC